MSTETPTTNPSKRPIKQITVATTLASALLAIGIIPRVVRAGSARDATRDSPVNHPSVTVLHAERGQPTAELLLPGNIEPEYRALIYARTDGYIQKRYVDIGAKVHTGQILAEISAPEVDQQLIQAKATLAQSAAALQQAQAALQQTKANLELARLTRDRDIPLGQQHAISQQIVDEAVQAFDARAADVAAAEANIQAAEANEAANRANVARLNEVKSFQRVLAPFDGVITERNAEQGDLVSSTSGGAFKPLFVIAQGKMLRVFVDVPQTESINIRESQIADVTVGEHIGRVYQGTVVRNANALNSAARTLRTEVRVDNSDGSLLPGMYAQVKLALHTPRPALIVPTNALIIDQAGPHVAIVDAKHILHFKTVVVGRDMGNQVEVLSGISATDTLVASPSDLLSDGQTVEVR